MNAAQEKIERMLVLTRRLTQALHADIGALDRGRPAEMQSILPDTQQLLVQYAREVAALKPQLKLLPGEARKALTDATAELHEALALHERRLACVRRASEGMIRAVVDDVESRKRLTRPYAPRPATKASPGAMLYNGVV